MTTRILTLLSVILVAAPAPSQEIPKPMGLPLPPGAVARLGDPRGAVSDLRAGALALSPEGKLLAVGSLPITIRKPDTRELVATMDIPRAMYPRILTWSSDGKWLAAVGHNGLMCWDAATGKPRWSDKPREIGRYVTAIRFVDNDRRICVVYSGNEPNFTTGEFPTTRKDLQGNDDISERLRLAYLDAATGNFPDGFPHYDGKTIGQHRRAHRDAVNKDYAFCWIALSPSGSRAAWLASRPSDEPDAGSAVFVYDTATHKLLHTLKNLPRTYRIDLPDEGETVVLYPPRPPRGPVERTVTASFTVVGLADGKTRMTGEYRYRPAIALTGYDTININVFPARSAVRFRSSLITFDSLAMVRWDLETGRKLEELPLGYFPGRHMFTMSSDGKQIAIGLGRRWRVSAEKLADLREPEHCMPPTVEFLPDGRLRTASALEFRYVREVRVWDVRKGAVVESLRIHPWPHGIFPDWLVKTNPHGTVAAGIDHEAGGFVVYDQVKLEPLFVLKLDGVSTKEALQRNYQLTASGDGQRLLLSGFEDGTLLTRWYDRDGKELGRHSSLQAKTGWDNARWLDEAGTAFGYMLRDQRFALVDTATKKVTAILGASAREEWSYEIAGFGRFIVGTSRADKAPRMKIWDRQGRLVRDFTRRDDRGSLSPDGRTLAVRNFVGKWDARSVKSIKLYETATGRLHGELPVLGHADVDSGLSFAPDAMLLATASPDTSVLLWDIARPLSGKPALPAPKDAADAERLWEVLGDPNPAEADLALWTLVAAPDHALRLAHDYLIPAVHPDPKRIQPLIAQLGAATLKERDAASRELLGVGEAVLPALPALRAALKESKSDDQRRRLESLIAQLQPRLEFPTAIASNLREIRMLEVLERIGTTEGKKMVEALATGTADALLTREASLVLARCR